MIINETYINALLNQAKTATKDDIKNVLDKAKQKVKLSHKDIAILLQINDKDLTREMFNIAGQIKQSIYGSRIVIFAPLYISNFCVNNCTYCGYQHCNKIERTKLNKKQIQDEVKILLKMGHKRIALEAGEDPKNCPIDYITESIKTIYETAGDKSGIRRINVNIAATTVENYKKLKDANIGTYILFQETYNATAYKNYHPNSIKGDYEYHLTAFDRAMEAGIDDVGGGVLFGLSDYKFEVLSLMLHNEHLENKFGVGFHTISVPRLKKAEGMTLADFPHLVDDETFKRIVAIIRLAVPFTGIILSTRESEQIRKELITYGVSQVSAGSCTGVGGYKEYEEKGIDAPQFELADHRTPLEVLKSLVSHGHLPSYCTACYRNGRTGDRFMRLARSGQIQYVCQPNAIMTFMEYLLDYADDELMQMGTAFIESEINKIERNDIRQLVKDNVERLNNGERDLYL